MAHEYWEIPKNAKFVSCWDDLPAKTSKASYIKHKYGEGPSTFVVSDHQRQVLEGLMRRPIFSASPCRLSEYVSQLRKLGLETETNRFSSLPEDGGGTVGLYFLRDAVRQETVRSLENADDA